MDRPGSPEGLAAELGVSGGYLDEVAVEPCVSGGVAPPSLLDAVDDHRPGSKAPPPPVVHHRPSEFGVLSPVGEVLVEAMRLLEGLSTVEDVGPFEPRVRGRDVTPHRPGLEVRHVRPWRESRASL